MSVEFSSVTVFSRSEHREAEEWPGQGPLLEEDLIEVLRSPVRGNIPVLRSPGRDNIPMLRSPGERQYSCTQIPWKRQYSPAPSPGYLPRLPDHDVVAVPVPNAQHVGGHAVASTGQGELLDGLVQGISREGKKEGKNFTLDSSTAPGESCFQLQEEGGKPFGFL